MSERTPKRISLDNYTGIAADYMQLNEPVAQRYMQVADMRRDIEIMNGRPDRTRSYDQLGTVLVRKLIGNASEKPGPTHTDIKDGVWVVEIDSQQLQSDLHERRSYRTQPELEEQFISEFQRELRKGLRACLSTEKLLNDGERDFYLGISYGFLVGITSQIAKRIAEFGQAQSQSSLENIATLSKIVLENFAWANIIKWTTFYIMKILLERQSYGTVIIEPPSFVRSSFKEIFLPSVPVDRLIRGLTYLWVHGDEFIQKPE